MNKVTVAPDIVAPNALPFATAAASRNTFASVVPEGSGVEDGVGVFVGVCVGVFVGIEF